MKALHKIRLMLLAVFAAASCTPSRVHDGASFLFDNSGNVIPCVYLDVSEGEWNRLLESFDGCSPTEYRLYLLPHDYDNTLGTCHTVGAQTDAARQNPYEWGPTDPAVSPLLNKILAFDDYRALYTSCLRELASVGGLLTYESSIARIRAWQEMIAPYIANDTGEDMALRDVPAPWGNHPEYRVVEDGEDNFFRVRTAALLHWTAEE